MKVKAISGLLAVILAACSIQISDVTPGPTAPVQTAAPSGPGLPASALPPASSVGPAWASLNLSGQLLFTQGVNGVERVNLATGARVALFKPPENAWLTAASVSPDGSQIVLAYAPPPPEGQIQFGYTGLYLMPVDASATPAPMLERTDPQESYFTPSWSPDGKYVYYAHFIPLKGESGNTFRYTVERLALGGSPEVLLDNAIWPRLSPDGSKLAYLTFDLQTFNNDLYVAEADGQNSRPVIPPGTFQAVDAHLWTPDGQAIIFSAVGEGPAYQSTPAPALSWLDRLLGVEAASAHNVPSDWWRVSLDGAELTRLTKIYDTGLYGGFSPDGSRVAFIAASGLYVMNPDGSELTPVIPVDKLGTLEWIE